MKNYFALFLLMLSSTLFAQDVIVKKDGSTILSKVYEIGKKDIKYKKFSNLNGPIYNISIKEVLSVNYENGEKDLFDKIEQIDKPLYKDVETNSSYKTETNMYSNISIGYANFAISSSETTLLDCSYNSNGFAVEYNYGIKPIRKIGLYFETGLKATCTFAKDVFVIICETALMDGLFRYFSISIPLNFKYKFTIPNSHLAIYPYIGLYYKRNVVAKQKNSWSEIDFIAGSMPSYLEEGVYVVEDYLKYQKNQIGWQVGLSLEYKNYNISGYYSRDFRSIVTNNSIFNKYYASQFGVSIGYRFDMFK